MLMQAIIIVSMHFYIQYCYVVVGNGEWYFTQAIVMFCVTDQFHKNEVLQSCND